MTQRRPMILIATNAIDPHADAVIEYLEELGTSWIRFNTEDFPELVQMSVEVGEHMSAVQLTVGGRDISAKDVGAVWYRRPELPVLPDLNSGLRDFALEEIQACRRGLWEALRSEVLWVNHPHDIRRAANKMWQLEAARQIGFNVPDTLITNVNKRVMDFYEYHSGNIIGKPLSRSYLEVSDSTGVERLAIFTNKIERRHLEVLDGLRYGPVIFQNQVPKKYEVRATVVGEEVFACRIESQESERTRGDWRRYDLANTPHKAHELDPVVASKCVEITRKAGLLFSAIDLIVTPDEETVFLEVNPNGQWLWIEQLTGLPIARALARLLAG